MNVTDILPVLQMVLTSGNICILAYALFKFLNRPHDTLDGRVNALEIEIKELKQSLLLGNDRFREQDTTNEVIIRSTLALVEFEMQYCLTEHKDMSDGLKQAKKDLNDFLAKR